MSPLVAVVFAVAADGDVCAPAPGFPAVTGRKVELKSVPVEIDRWDADRRLYVPAGLVAGHTLHDSEFKAMTHGPKIRRADVKKQKRETASPEAFAKALPPTYFTATYADRFYELDQINASAAPLGSGKLGSGASWTGNLKMMGYAIAPSTVYPIESDDDNEELHGFLVAEGNPFAFDPGNHTSQMNLGGVAYMNASGCKTLFPVAPSPWAKTGRVINTVDCHKRLGMCFFSAWKFDGGMFKRALPDCLWYCKPDSLTQPTKCVAEGIVKDEVGREICRDYGMGGGVHGLTVMKDDPTDPQAFDLMLIFTAGPGYKTGASWISVLKVSVAGVDAPFVRGQTIWGESLWNDTVAKPDDVGCDHAFLDDAGQVWVSTFRSGNAGLHLLDYDTGVLQYSLHGFTDYTRFQYSYPAGVSGYGTLGQKNSLMALATSSERFGIPIMGTATMWFLDVSTIISK